MSSEYQVASCLSTGKIAVVEVSPGQNIHHLLSASYRSVLNSQLRKTNDRSSWTKKKEQHAQCTLIEWGLWRVECMQTLPPTWLFSVDLQLKKEQRKCIYMTYGRSLILLCCLITDHIKHKHTPKSKEKEHKIQFQYTSISHDKPSRCLFSC